MCLLGANEVLTACINLKREFCAYNANHMIVSVFLSLYGTCMLLYVNMYYTLNYCAAFTLSRHVTCLIALPIDARAFNSQSPLALALDLGETFVSYRVTISPKHIHAVIPPMSHARRRPSSPFPNRGHYKTRLDEPHVGVRRRGTSDASTREIAPSAETGTETSTGGLPATHGSSWYDGMAAGGGSMTGRKRYVCVCLVGGDGSWCAGREGLELVRSFFSCAVCFKTRARNLGSKVCVRGDYVVDLVNRKSHLLGARVTACLCGFV